VKKIEIVLRLDIALVQRIKSRPKSREPERPDTGKTTRAALIDAIARSLLANGVDVSGFKNGSRYLFENKSRLYLMYEACPRNV
jgi:hypothetical protein